MSLKNRYNLWKLKQNFAPSKIFKDGLWRDLNSAWNSRYGRPTWLQIGLLHKGAAFAVVTLLLIGSTGAYAYVSPEVTEGTVFYPIKQVVESVEEVVKITPEAKAKFYLKQIKRREAEKAGLVRKNLAQAGAKANVKAKVETKDFIDEVRIEKTEKSIERAEDHLERIEKIVEKIGSKDKKLREEVKNRLEIRLEKRQKQSEKKAEKQKERMEKLETLKTKGRETQKY